MMSSPFRMFEQLTALVAREGIAAGEIGEVCRIYGDGSVDLEIIERDDPPTFVILGLPNRPPYSRRVNARFRSNEVARTRR